MSVAPEGEGGWGPGARVGGYRLVRELGRGGMGAVYLAEQVETGAQRVLKTLTDVHDPDLIERFDREAQALAAVDDHPNVVRVHTAGAEGGRPFLVMDWVQGGSLQDRLRRGRLPPDEAARIVSAVARGLAHGHQRGILHRDIKPDNVLFDEEGVPKLADFGLARIAGAKSLTLTGELLGTPTYMAPEQAQSLPVDARADVYSLGALLYATLTGRPPFVGSTTVEVLSQVLERAPRPPQDVEPEVPSALGRICLRALAKAPEDRFESAAGFADALDAHLAGEAPTSLLARTGPLPLVAAAAFGMLLGAGLLVTIAVKARPKPVEPLPPPPIQEPPTEAEPPPPATLGDLAELDPAERGPALHRWIGEQRDPAKRASGLELLRETLREPLLELEHPALHMLVAFLGSERIVTAGGHHVRLWSARTGELLAERELQLRVESLDATPSGERFALGLRAGRAVLFDGREGSRLGSILVHAARNGGGQPVTSVALDADGAVLFAGTGARHAPVTLVRVFDTESRERLYELGRFDGQTSVYLSPDGRSLLTSTAQRHGPEARRLQDFSSAVQLWRLGETPRRLHSFRLHERVTLAAFASDGRFVVGNTSGSLNLYDREGQDLVVYRSPDAAEISYALPGRLRGAAFSQDGDVLFACSDGERGRAGEDNQVAAWSAWTNTRLAAALHASGNYLGLDLAPLGARLVVAHAAEDGVVARVFATDVLRSPPDWYSAAPHQAPWPLPAEVWCAEDPETYLNARDGSVLVYVPASEDAPGFFIGKYEADWGRVRVFLRVTGARIEGSEFDLHATAEAHLPASKLPWTLARDYCAWAGLRLPTESEWDRAAGPKPFAWGDGPQPGRLPGKISDLRAHDVDLLGMAPSPAGCVNMGSSVSEWTADLTSEGKAVWRGGSFVSEHNRSSIREVRAPSTPRDFVGFRVCRDAQ